MVEFSVRTDLAGQRNPAKESSYTIMRRPRRFLSDSYEVREITDPYYAVQASGEYTPAGVLTKDRSVAEIKAKEMWAADSSYIKVLFFGIRDKALIQKRKELKAAQNDSEAIDNQLSLKLPKERKSARLRFKNTLLFNNENSSKISSLSYVGGNGILTGKAGIHPDGDTVMGISYLLSDIPLYFAGKYPTTAYRIMSAFCLIGSLAFGYKGIDFEKKQIYDGWRIASSAGMAGTAVLIGLQKEIAQAAEKAKTSKNNFKRAFAATQRYPVAFGAAIDLLTTAGVGISAYKNKDGNMLVATALYGIAAVELGLSDPRLRMKLQNYIGIYPIDKKSEQVGEEERESQGGTIFDSNQLNLQLRI